MYCNNVDIAYFSGVVNIFQRNTCGY